MNTVYNAFSVDNYMSTTPAGTVDNLLSGEQKRPRKEVFTEIVYSSPQSATLTSPLVAPDPDPTASILSITSMPSVT